MKKKKLVLRWLRLSLVAAFNLPFSAAFAQGTAFTYQGRLQNNGAPANGLYDLQFTVLGAFTNGVIAGGPLTNSATTVSNGLFTVVPDSGAEEFTGADRWLEIAVRTNGAVAFSTLQPRQQLTPSPYAIQAASAASLSGAVSDSQLPADVARLGANNNFTGTNGLNDADLRLRSNGDVHHGLGWYGGTKTFGTFSPDGPVLFGNLGGGL